MKVYFLSSLSSFIFQLCAKINVCFTTQDIFITMLLVASSDVQMCLLSSFEMIDIENSRLLSKAEFERIFTLLNNTFLNFSDKYLHKFQILDLVDSIFTTSGRIDGYICYDDYLGIIEEHPIIELLLSPQFQGIFCTYYQLSTYTTLMQSTYSRI